MTSTFGCVYTDLPCTACQLELTTRLPTYLLAQISRQTSYSVEDQDLVFGLSVSVLPFALEHLQSQPWRERVAASSTLSRETQGRLEQWEPWFDVVGGFGL